MSWECTTYHFSSSDLASPTDPSDVNSEWSALRYG